VGDDLKYRIKIEGDVASAQKVEKALNDVNKAAKQVGKEAEDSAKRLRDYFRQAALEAKFLEKASREAQRGGAFTQADFKTSATKRVGFLQKAGGEAGKLAAAFGINATSATALGATAAAAKLAAESLKEYATAEERVASLDAALAQRGQLTDLLRTKLQHLASAQQQLTGIASASWLEVITRLVQAGAAGDNIDKLLEGTKNLAGMMQGDLQAASMAIGKALNGNFDQFTRLGIEFSDNATKAQKLDQLWRELAARGGGQLEARNDTLKGSFRNLKNETTDLLQGLGSLFVAIVPVKGAINGVASAVHWLNGLFSSTIPKSDALKNSMRSTGAAMESVEEIVKRYAKKLEDLKSANTALATETDRATEAMRKQMQIDNDVDAANADALLKRVDMDEKGGRLTPTQAATRRTQIKRDLDEKKFKREQELRSREIGNLSAREEQLTQTGAEANEDAIKQKDKLDELTRLQKERERLTQRGNMRVQIAQSLYDKTSRLGGPERMAAASALNRAKQDASYALYSFDVDNGIKDGNLGIEDQEKRFKAAQEYALKVNTDNGALAGDLNARKRGLQADQIGEMRKHGWTREANRLEAQTALQEARHKERGEVQRNSDGSIEIRGGSRSGNRAALEVEKQSEALTRATPNYQLGSRRDTAQVASRDREIRRLQDIVDALTKLSVITPAMEARIKAATDRIDVLESQNRNRSNR
jgi:hypothetical protein